MPSPRTVSYTPGFTLLSVSKTPSKPQMQETDASETPLKSSHSPTSQENTSPPSHDTSPSSEASSSASTANRRQNRKRIDRKRHHFLKYSFSDADRTVNSVALVFPPPPIYVALPVSFPQPVRASLDEEAELVRVKEQFNAMKAKLSKVVEHQRDMAAAMESLMLEMSQLRDRCRDCRACRESLGTSSSSTDPGKEGMPDLNNGLFEGDADGFYLVSDELDGYEY
ncbi:hypothetical protein BC830DRAFT_1168589 [Chytriomyces sp. MP71]|nr:hypothetical protein BC830DRAFT_1168589 [Chytriomyces sp. MP71]